MTYTAGADRNRKMTSEDRAYIVEEIRKFSGRKIKWKDVMRFSEKLKTRGFSREALQGKPDIRAALQERNNLDGPVKRKHTKDAREKAWRAKEADYKATIDALRHQNAALLVSQYRRADNADAATVMQTPKPNIRNFRDEERDARRRKVERERKEAAAQTVTSRRRSAYIQDSGKPAPVTAHVRTHGNAAETRQA